MPPAGVRADELAASWNATDVVYDVAGNPVRVEGAGEVGGEGFVVSGVAGGCYVSFGEGKGREGETYSLEWQLVFGSSGGGGGIVSMMLGPVGDTVVA